MVTIRVPATTANLGPGFDCLGLALEVFNTVEMEVTGSKVHIDIYGQGSGELPRDESNLVFRAAQEVFGIMNFIPPGVKIKLTNRIPVSSGLGSSAAAIVGGMFAANAILKNPLSIDEIIQHACFMEGHADNIVAAVAGGLVIVYDDGGTIRYKQIITTSSLKVVATTPEFELATENSRIILPRQIPFDDAKFNLSRLALLISAFYTGENGILGIAMEDKLHQTYRQQLVPGMKEVFSAARIAGASGFHLSGSGPTIVAYTEKDPDPLARAMEDTFRENGIKSKSMILNISCTGALAQ